MTDTMMDTTTTSLEDFIDTCYNLTQVTQTSTPSEPSESSSTQTVHGRLVQEVQKVQEVNKVNKEGVSLKVDANNEHCTESCENVIQDEQYNQGAKDSQGVSDTPKGLITMMKRAIQAQTTKKRKYEVSPIKSSQNLSTDQVQIAEGVFESLVGVMSHYLDDYRSKLARDVEVALERDRDEAEAAMNFQAHEISILTEELRITKEKYQIIEGRLTRTEKQVEDLREELLYQEARSMRDNLVFFNIPENSQSTENTEAVLRKFFTEEMKVGDEEMRKIRFDRVHRTGVKASGKRRTIVAKFNPSEGKEIVLKHTKNLVKAKKFGVSEQLPRELEERKKQLLPQFKAAKNSKKNAKFVLDRLVIDNKVTKVEKDSVKDVNVATTEVASSMTVKRAAPMKYENTTLQGHAAPITAQEDIMPAIHAIYGDIRVARATHNIYAYRLKHGDQVAEHYEDDGDHGAGRHLLNLLRELSITNQLVCVSRWCSGRTFLGRARYDHIVDAARLALDRD